MVVDAGTALVLVGLLVYGLLATAVVAVINGLRFHPKPTLIGGLVGVALAVVVQVTGLSPLGSIADAVMVAVPGATAVLGGVIILEPQATGYVRHHLYRKLADVVSIGGIIYTLGAFLVAGRSGMLGEALRTITTDYGVAIIFALFLLPGVIGVTAIYLDRFYHD